MAGLANGMISIIWVVTGILTILVPLVFRTVKVKDFQAMNMMYNWEEQAREYQQQMQYYDNNYQNQEDQQNENNQQYSQEYYQNEWEQMRESGLYDVNRCQWWQLNCYSYYINTETGEPEVQAGWYPNWYSGWAVTEEQREEMQEAGVTSGAVVFVYVWQIMMFLVILGYGYLVIKQGRTMTGLIVALVVFANMCFVNMWWLADGSIVTDSAYVQQTGFYGQFAVLMFITNAWYVVFGIVYTAIFAYRMQKEKGKLEDRQQEQKRQEPEQTYKAPVADDSPERSKPSEPEWTMIE